MTTNITKAMTTLKTQIEVVNKLSREKGSKIPKNTATKVEVFLNAAKQIMGHTNSSIVRGVQAYTYVGDPTTVVIEIPDASVDSGSTVFKGMQSILTYGDKLATELTSIK